MFNALTTSALPNQELAANRGATAAVPLAAEHGETQPFQAVFSEQLQAIRLIPSSPAPLMTAAGLGPMLGGHGFAGGGLGLPGLLAPGGFTLESVTYSRVVFGDGSGLEELPAEGGEEPAADLAALLNGLPAAEGESAEAPLPEAVTTTALAPTEPEPERALAAESAPSTDVFSRPDLGDKIGRSVANIANTGSPGADLAVDHPEYGRVEAQVRIKDDGAVELSFGSENAGLRGSLEAARADIESSLAEQGLTLTEFNVVDTSQGVSVLADAGGESLNPAVTGLDAAVPFSQLDANLARAINPTALDLVQS